MSSSIGIVILAAGGSSRMGSPKQLVEIEGEFLLVRTVGVAKAAALGPVAVVLGGHADVVRPAVADLGVTVVENPDWEIGLGGSIRVGMRALLDAHPMLDAVVLTVGDLPGLTASWLRTLAATLGEANLAAASYDGVLGTPAAFGRLHFETLLSLPSEEGAKRILRRPGVRVEAVPFAAGALDLDSPADVDAWHERVAQTQRSEKS